MSVAAYVPPEAMELSLEQRVARLERMFGLATPSGNSNPVPWPLRQAELLRQAARLWFLSVDDIIGDRRYRDFCLARAAVVLVLREAPGTMSYPQIGALLGGRDHTSVIGLERMAQRAMRDRPGFARAVEELRASFQPKPEEASA